MNTEPFDDQLRRALTEGEALSEEKLESIRKESREEFEMEKRVNRLFIWAGGIGAAIMVCVWGFLFWRSEDPKFQLLWIALLIMECLGGIMVWVLYLLYENRLVMRRDMLALEMQLLEMRENK